MNFYASPEYLRLVSDAYFKGLPTRVEDVRIGRDVLRVLVVDGARVITEVPFLDYHEPLIDAEVHGPARTHGYAPWVTREVIDQSAWQSCARPGLEAAPYVDWSTAPTFDGYLALLKTRWKGILKENERRRRRLAEDFGELSFSVDDGRDDVFELARKWKQRQLVATGANDYLANPQNVEFLRLARERGILVSSTIRAAGRLLSVWLGFIHAGVWSGWIFAYDHDPSLRKYSLGHQLLRSMLEESHRRKHRELDFSIGGEDYKWIYATHARVLGPVGRAPLQQRVVTLAKQQAKIALAAKPAWLELARSLRDRAASLPITDRARPAPGEET
jgi:CelD/BcsL family acetyltransferase involved in cellulose biosynthesis